MNQTTPYRNMKRARYTAECLANARILPDAFDGDWLDMLIKSRNDLLMCPDNPSFAGNIRDRDDRNEWYAATVWRMYRNVVDYEHQLGLDSDPEPRHYTIRRYRHATDLENRMQRLPWFMRRQAV